MAAVDLDRQSIERRDFPIGRRGYDPAAVDAHLRTLAAEVEELKRMTAGGGGEPSLGSTAGTQVQSILEAAEAAAADIERQAQERARNAREEADRDAERTRADAVKRAQEHVAAVSQATAVLLQRVESMDGEVSALVDSLRAGASRLAGDLTAVETNMSELYDAASGRGGVAVAGESAPVIEPPSVAELSPVAEPRVGGPPAVEPALAELPSAVPLPLDPSPERPSSAAVGAEPGGGAADLAPAPGGGDLDGARLIALNMALNGESREAADQYLAEKFELADRQRLIEEVYAAIEG